MEKHHGDPGKREAQHLLASEVLEMVHGREEAEKTRAEHQSMRNPSLAFFATSDAEGTSREVDAAQDVNRISLPRMQVLSSSVAHVLYQAGLAKSKSEGARMIHKGGVYVAAKADSGELDFVKIEDPRAEDVEGLVVDNLLVFRLGKWKVRIIELVDDDLSSIKAAEGNYVR